MTGGSKCLTSADEYVCTLPKDVLAIAKDELREDEAAVKQALDSMREWILQNPKILQCRFDANFLLRFVRTRKFSVMQAENMLERYIMMRQFFGDPLFGNIMSRIGEIEELIDCGYKYVSPVKDKQGRTVMIVRPGAYDLDRHLRTSGAAVHAAIAEACMEDEENQVKGYVYLVDLEGLGLKHLTVFTIKEVFRMVKNGEHTLPMRHKEAHVINVHPSLKAAKNFIVSLLSKKIQSRINFYVDKEDCIQSNTLDLNTLPEEYGGPLKKADMLLYTKKLIQDHKKILDLNDQLEVDPNMFSEKHKDGAVSTLHDFETIMKDSDILGITGNFRKLEVD